MPDSTVPEQGEQGGRTPAIVDGDEGVIQRRVENAATRFSEDGARVAWPWLQLRGEWMARRPAVADGWIAAMADRAWPGLQPETELICNRIFESATCSVDPQALATVTTRFMKDTGAGSCARAMADYLIRCFGGRRDVAALIQASGDALGCSPYDLGLLVGAITANPPATEGSR